MKVTVCMGSSCVMMGNMNILSQLEDLQESMPELDLEIETVKCLGDCKVQDDVAPVVKIDGETIVRATSQTIMEKVTQSLR